MISPPTNGTLAVMITVVGAANLDVQAFVTDRLVPGDSSPGRISTSAGGVGRNIAHNLRLLGDEVRFVTALAEDENSSLIRLNLRNLEIDHSRSLVCPNARTSSYVCIVDERGKLFGGVNDMGILERLTPEFLRDALSVLRADDIVIVDANLPERSLIAVRDAAVFSGARLVVDTVSETKCPRCLPILGSSYAIKPNRAEIRALTGVEVSSHESAARAADVLHGIGVRYVCVSLGRDGVLYSGDGVSGVVAVANLPVVNVSGAGDALSAGLAHSLALGADIRAAASFAQACASLTCACEATTSDALSESAARELATSLIVKEIKGERS